MKGFNRWLRSSTTLDDGLRGCFGKSAYSTEKKAQETLNKRQAETSDNLRYYKCDICKMFHLTKKPLRMVEEKPVVKETLVVDLKEKEELKEKYFDVLYDLRIAISENQVDKAKELKTVKKTLIREMKQKGYEVP